MMMILTIVIIIIINNYDVDDHDDAFDDNDDAFDDEKFEGTILLGIMKFLI